MSHVRVYRDYTDKRNIVSRILNILKERYVTMFPCSKQKFTADLYFMIISIIIEVME